MRKTGVVMTALFLMASVSLAFSAREQQALDLLQKRFKQYGNKVTSLQEDCFSFMIWSPESKDPGVPVEVREKHDKVCGGDPQTAPIVARFEVRGKKVFILNNASGDYVPFDSRWNPK